MIRMNIKRISYYIRYHSGREYNPGLDYDIHEHQTLHQISLRAGNIISVWNLILTSNGADITRDNTLAGKCNPRLDSDMAIKRISYSMRYHSGQENNIRSDYDTNTKRILH